jgi:FOG: EAL domain
MPLFLMIVVICYSRKMSKGTTNQLFLSLVSLSIVSTAADLCMVILGRRLPLSGVECAFETALAYVYLASHNAANAVLQLFLLSLTRTTSLFKKRSNRIIFNLPNIVIFLLLAQNPFTHTVFTVTAEAGYARGAWMPLVYAMAAVYGVSGLAYCIYSRRFFPTGKWAALLTMYILTFSAVIIQFLCPELLLEMFFSGVGAMGVMLSIMRPEERMDSLVGMGSWNAYQEDLKNILLSGERVQIVVIRLQNAQEIIGYLGDHQYNGYVSEIAKAIRELQWKHRHGVELYFERPGAIYLIGGEDEAGMENISGRLLRESGDRLRKYGEMGVRFEPQVCLIRCPDDLRNAEDIIGLGHRFHRIDAGKDNVFRAGDIVHSRVFAVESHMKEILNRAVKGHHIRMVFQPIYDVRDGAFHSAEALARIFDPEFGLISPAVFIPAAERMGLIIPVGDEVLDQVFRFISENDLDRPA